MHFGGAPSRTCSVSDKRELTVFIELFILTMYQGIIYKQISRICQLSFDKVKLFSEEKNASSGLLTK